MTVGPFDLDAYLARIHHAGGLAPRAATLEALQVAHLAWVPFENVDVRLGRPGRLDLDSLQAKMVAGRRGGYCFEQNTLFAAALRALGFEVTTLEARVRPPGATAPLPRTHMTLRVDVEGAAWLADVGFGGDGPLRPVRLDGTPGEEPDGTVRIDREGEGTFVLRRARREEWTDLYAFSLTPALAVDYEVAHWFTATHPSSPFVRTLTVQRSDFETRHILRGRTLTVRTRGEEVVREIRDEELPALLRDRFRLDLADEVALLALGPKPESAAP